MKRELIRATPDGYTPRREKILAMLPDIAPPPDEP
jgi:hypothetical protein